VRAGASGAVGRDAQDAATSGRRAGISLSGHIPVLEKLLGCQIARLHRESRGDIRREIAEADETSEIGRADAFALGKRRKGNLVAADEGRVKPARLEQQLD